jgi:hypothetical protein
LEEFGIRTQKLRRSAAHDPAKSVQTRELLLRSRQAESLQVSIGRVASAFRLAVGDSFALPNCAGSPAEVQGGLWELGGVSEVLRSDNLSAATHDLRRSRGRALNRRYRALLEHYGLRASLIQVGEAHENGVVEQAHRRTKSMLAHALLLRGSCNFSSVEAYQQWLRAVIEREHNAQLGERLAQERRHLRPLPAAPIPAYTTLVARVRRWSTTPCRAISIRYRRG